MITQKTEYEASEVGYDASRLDVLNAHFKRMIDKGELFSANYCLSRDGKVFAEAAMGKLSYREDDPRELVPDSIQWIASITKLFTATAIFRLVEDGFIRLNQNVGDLIKEMSLPPFNTITLAQLLSHTSGLTPDPNCFGHNYQKNAWDHIGTERKKPWLEAALAVGIRSKPGTEWAYCSFGYVILGEVISRVSGKHAHQYIEEEIIQPCGLRDTFFPITHPSNDDEHRRMMELAKRSNIRDKRNEREIQRLLEGKEAPKSRFDEVPMTGGGLVSTARDLNRFGVMLLNQGTIDGKRILGRRTYSRMTEMYTTQENRDWCWGSPGLYRPYALGPDRRRNADTIYSPSTFFHEGAGACALIVDPEERLVASWFVPFTKNAWHAHGLFNAASIMWSGLL